MVVILLLCIVNNLFWGLVCLDSDGISLNK